MEGGMDRSVTGHGTAWHGAAYVAGGVNLKRLQHVWLRLESRAPKMEAIQQGSNRKEKQQTEAR
eukprot:366244-Chlamydomonas_euryale.AAC.2